MGPNNEQQRTGHAQRYGEIGAAVPYATNSYYTAPAQPFNEPYGLAPIALTLNAMVHL